SAMRTTSRFLSNPRRAEISRVSWSPRTSRRVPMAQALRFRARNSRLQRSEQVFTSFQSSRHFFRHAKTLPQASQVFVGRSAFLRMRGMASLALRGKLLQQGPQRKEEPVAERNRPGKGRHEK